MAERSLDAYRARRDPGRTPEPLGGRPAGEGRRFVVHKHAARRLHYDLRLEIDGVLVSWAVPKGPSLRPQEKRLAVHVEDHPVEYAAFEGVIPAGSYGAGPSIVWDAGWYRLTRPEPAAAQLARGRLEFELHGFKLGGRFTLARMSGKEREWLLLKKADAFASDREPTERFPESVLSGLTVEELRAGTARLATLAARLDALGAPARAVPPPREPMLATLVERPFSDPAWLFEIKYDGVRVLAAREGERVELRGRSGLAVTARYPEVARALRALPLPRFLLDGEIVALDEAGRSSFQRLQARMGLTRPADVARAEATVPVSAVFFDALALDGRDLRALPLEARKECLRLVLPRRGVVAWGDHVVEHGEAFFEEAGARGLEGVVGKRRASRYVTGRSRDWRKVKCQRRQEFVIGGFTAPRGSRARFGALHLGLSEDGRLVYVGKVGTGFDEATLARVHARLVPLARATSPFAAGAPAGRGHHWVEPRLVCEVRFTEWTKDGGIRHPTFVGLRDDKRPADCVRETSGSGPGTAGAPGFAATLAGEIPPPPRPTGAPAGDERRVVTITNAAKVFWPEEGLTKADLVEYYDRVAPWLLPYLAGRPLVLTRYPDGIAGKFFFQKDAPGWAPAWVRTERIHAGDAGRDIAHLVVDDRESLRWVVNLGAIPLHVWASRVGALDRPDWLVLDLDPKGAPFTDVVRVAQALRRLLEALELPSHVKTSGATGLHILLPLGARYRYEEARGFAHLLAMLGVEAEPGLATVARPLRARGGKVYIDYGQNARGQTIVAPLAVRPLPGAPVSCPLRWEEVTARLDPGRFTLRTVPARLERLGDPLRPVLGPGLDMAAALARLERRARRGR
ncbi:MAG: DNA ligase D [Candidatus Rokubacteria bacterium RIFCSPLOWO2_02_FULL_73_56]|nr:MAG: DNA ligase D [Candidatus Rokubacteria bacterium RIFCSPLOWO2_02_FULL_73_56]OGL28417.1 MAG: DNA ligase D [Candidatus Rokubacteria bacterium RIFCSPLOWO2_12_FULL_73_47]